MIKIDQSRPPFGDTESARWAHQNSTSYPKMITALRKTKIPEQGGGCNFLMRLLSLRKKKS